jgi:hypothetical protein
MNYIAKVYEKAHLKWDTLKLFFLYLLFLLVELD